MIEKKKLKEILEAYYRNIRKDMGFCIKYRPSTWRSLIPQIIEKPIKKFFIKKSRRRLVFYSVLILSLMFTGLVSTINFIFSNIWKLWLIPIIVCVTYWVLAISAVYLKVTALFLSELILVVFEKLIDRKL